MAKAKPKKKNGRPSKFEAIDLRQVELLAGYGFKDTELAHVLGIAESTLNYYKHRPEFLEALSAGKERADSQVVESLFQAARAGNVTACIFWLKNRRKQDWRDKFDMEHGGSIESRVIQMTPDERRDRLDLLKMKINAN